MSWYSSSTVSTGDAKPPGAATLQGMRRLVAVFCTASLANLAMVQAVLACPVAGQGTVSGSAVVDVAGGHEEHEAAPATEHEGRGHLPGSQSGCQAMNACALAIDVAAVDTRVGVAQQVSHVIGASDRSPASLASAPDLPPPRA